MAQFQKQLLGKTIKASMLYIQSYRIADSWKENFNSDDHSQGSFSECTKPMRDDVTMYYNMTVWILAGNYISFTIAAGLIRLHMPGVKKSRV